MFVTGIVLLALSSAGVVNARSFPLAIPPVALVVVEGPRPALPLMLPLEDLFAAEDVAARDITPSAKISDE